MIKAVFFDINDTLINHSQAQEIAISKMADLLSQVDKVKFIKIWKKEANRYWKLFEDGKITFDQQRLQRVKSVWNHFEIKLTIKQIEQYADYYFTFYEENLRIQPILNLFLELLFEYHIPVGIISNGYGPLQRNRLKIVGIEKYLTDRLIFISDEIGFAKPDKRLFIFVESKAGVSPSEIIFIGDDLKYDIEPAKKRGWRTIQVSY